MKKTSLVSLEMCRTDQKYDIYQNFCWVYENNFLWSLQSGRFSLEEGWTHPLHGVGYSAGVTLDIKHIYSYYTECMGIYRIFTSFQASHPSFEWEDPTTGGFSFVPNAVAESRLVAIRTEDLGFAIHSRHSSKGTETDREGEIICASKKVEIIYFHSSTMRKQEWNCPYQNSVWEPNS